MTTEENESEENHDTAHDTETTEEDESTEEEATINHLLERIAALEQHNAELEQRCASLESRLDEHHAGYKHEPVPAKPATESEPEPRHWYFKRVGGER